MLLWFVMPTSPKNGKNDGGIQAYFFIETSTDRIHSSGNMPGCELSFGLRLKTRSSRAPGKEGQNELNITGSGLGRKENA